MVIDELRWQSLGDRGIPLLLSILGDGPCRVEIKGGFAALRATWIFITSQDDPDVTFQHGGRDPGMRMPLENIGQVIRRLDRIVEWSGFADPVTGEYHSSTRDVTDEFRNRFCKVGIFNQRQPLNVHALAETLGIDLTPVQHGHAG